MLENLKKTWKIREKQLKMIGSIEISRELKIPHLFANKIHINCTEKAKEYEKKREEEYYQKHGHPVDNAEKRFFETVEKMKNERQAIYSEIMSQLEK